MAGRRQGIAQLEILLKGAEAGSLGCIEALHKSWPQDFLYANRALLILLRNLDRRKIPDLRRGWDALNRAEAHHVLVIRTSATALNATFVYMQSLKDHLGQILELFQEHLLGLLATLKFISIHSSVILVDCVGSRVPVRLGYVLEASNLETLLDGGTKYFEREDGHATIRMLVDSVVDCWIRSVRTAPPVEEVTLSPEDHDLYTLHAALSQCLEEDSTANCMWNTATLFNEKATKSFAESFMYRLAEWATIHGPGTTQEAQNLNCTPLVTSISAATRLLAIPSFEHALLKLGFVPLAVKLAWTFRHAVSTREEGGSIATEIAACLDPTEKRTPDGVGKDPLKRLFSACHHPRIYDALACAEQRCPSLTRRWLEADRFVRESHKAFTTCLGYYKSAAERSISLAGSLHCACLKHHQEGRNSISGQAFQQCAHCKTVVYCSPECQKMDWKLLHREECPTFRLRRIDCMQSGAWLSHQERMRYIYTLQCFFDHGVLQRILPSIPHPSEAVQVMSPTKPVQIFVMFTSEMPMDSAAYSAKEFFAIGKDGVYAFTDERFRVMVDAVQQLEATYYVGLGTLVAPFGEYTVCAMGVFRLEREDLNPDGDEPPDSALGTLLNGHVQIVGPRW